jgi:hypothetical protein
MTKTSLSSLYRRLTATATPALDADDLASAADGTLPPALRDDVAAKLSASSAQSKLVRMLRELKTDSEALAFGIARTQRDTSTHRDQRAPHRTAAGRRIATVARWSAAMAACLVAVVGLFALRQQPTPPMATPAAHTVARADQIFSTRDHIFSDNEPTQHNASAKGDEVFRGGFNGG